MNCNHIARIVILLLKSADVNSQIFFSIIFHVDTKVFKKQCALTCIFADTVVANRG
jgi:hypothetical protein